MKQVDNDTSKAIAISNLLFILAFIGLILGGLSISGDKSPYHQKILSRDNVISLFQDNIINRSSNTSTMLANIDTSSVEEKSNQMVVDKVPPNKRVADLDSNRKAMLGMFLVMLKQR